MPKRPAGDRPAQLPVPRERVAHGAASPAPPGHCHCYGYARVSTVQQADEGESLDVQQRVIAGYAQMHGLMVDQGVRGARRVGIEAAG